MIQEVVDFARQINLEEDSDDVQELLDSHNQELTIDELLEMREQVKVIEKLDSLDPVQIEDQRKRVTNFGKHRLTITIITRHAWTT